MCCVCIGQGTQGAPGLPGIRGKPGPQVSSGFNDQTYIKSLKCGRNAFYVKDLGIHVSLFSYFLAEYFIEDRHHSLMCPFNLRLQPVDG